MFVNRETNRPAYLVDHDGDVTFSDSADLGRPHHKVASHRFFADHREATAEEISEADQLQHVRRVMRAPAAPKERKKPTARARKPKGKPAAGKASQPAPKTGDGDKQPPASADAASTIVSIAGSTRSRSTESRSVTWSAAVCLPS